jgi:Inosine-uridine preferring nucleoside hydrolase/Purple acid Phosphatase, N-terminal domain
MPNDGTATADIDFTGPCAAQASASTPTPESAVTVYRRALAAQPDGSVVMVTTGYLGNMAALLNSAPDSISSLSGSDLVQKKVKMLVVMGGGYPSRPAEHNLAGDSTAAQIVTGHWPTKIVWDGYEVGDNVHTGQTIPSTHPASSPVRIAFGAFVSPGNWYYSYDLTAVYHAIRPTDAAMTEAGPGSNVIDDNGGNVFGFQSPASQYYLQLNDAAGLGSSLESLLDTQPAAPDTTPPAISGVASGSITSAGATVAWSTDEPADTQVEYGTTTSYGNSTTPNTALATAHSQALSGLTAGTLYHYRVKSRDAAGNLAVSPDATFTTTAATSGPSVSAPSTAATGATVTVSWQGIAAPSNFDWIGLYMQGAENNAFATWFYTATCTKSAGPAQGSGSCSVTMPANPATYEFRLSGTAASPSSRPRRSRSVPQARPRRRLRPRRRRGAPPPSRGRGSPRRRTGTGSACTSPARPTPRS